MDQQEAVRRALARSRLYRFLSPLFLYPDEGTFSGLNWEEAWEALTILGSPEGLAEVLASLRGCMRHPVDIQAEYGRVFGHTLSEQCPPYETPYGSAHIFQQAQALADIAGFYRAFGLEVSDQVKERLDHIAVELEFMAFLAHKEAYALAADGEEQAELCREAQEQFLHDHLAGWVPLFARQLEEKGGFYRGLALLTERFLASEVEAFGVKPLKVERLTRVPFKPEGRCFSCGGSGLCFPGEESSWGESGEFLAG